MKTDLDHLPGHKQRELQRVLDIVHEEFEDATTLGTSQWKRKARIRSVILFGSYARGGWVDERHTSKGYQSDYDLLIIVNHQKPTEHYELWDRLWDRLFREKGISTPVNFIVHTLAEVNDALSLGRYFFVDIYREGIELYGTKGTKLQTPKPLAPQPALEMAEEHAGFWIGNVKTSLKVARFCISEGDLNRAAFDLHQATEAAYNAFLLTLTNYCPATHNLNALRGLAEGMDERLIDAWPRATKSDTKPFNKLVDAYVKARYSRHYKIDTETLEWLIARIEHLHDVIEVACKKRIAELKKSTGSPGQAG
jgi:predicted nucleotidyltransferase/HEPN domain-containing protein